MPPESRSLTDPQNPQRVTAANRYSQLESKRNPALHRARDNARLTIPSLVPPEGHNESTTYLSPQQSIGALGVNNLANRLVTALFPPGRSFFKLQIDSLQAKQMGMEIPTSSSPEGSMMTQVELALSSVEKAVVQDAAADGDGPKFFEAMRRLVVAGDTLLEMKPQGIRVHPLSSYVIRRDPLGRALEIVIAEKTPMDGLDEAVLDQVRKAGVVLPTADETQVPDLTIYTWVRLDKAGKYHDWHQEIENVQIQGSEARARLEVSPWLALRFHSIDGEDYGRSLCEEFYGDLLALETLTEALKDGARASAMLLIFVDPTSGLTSVEEVRTAENGATLEGRAEDVTVLQLSKASDFQFATQLRQDLERRLSAVFLLNASIRRDAERVTAEEIRLMAEELETALGGFYSLMAQDLQLPYVRQRLDAIIDRSGPATQALRDLMPEGDNPLVRPTILTGFAALGRNDERNRLLVVLRSIQETMGPRAIETYLEPTELIRKLFLGEGIDTEFLLKSPDAVAAFLQQERMAALMNTVGPNMVTQGGQMLQNQQQENAENGNQAQAQGG